MKTRRKVVNSRVALRFEITKKHVKLAKKCDATGCVVAQALLDSLGEMLDSVQVGSNVTKVVTDSKVFRYTTPTMLKQAIPEFDRTGIWNLKPGTYHLAPYSKVNRHKEIKRETGGKLVKFTGGKRKITRKVKAADTLATLEECK
jgi:hypothetical protein